MVVVLVQPFCLQIFFSKHTKTSTFLYLLNFIVVLVSPIIFPVQSSMSLGCYACQLAVVQTAMSADLHFTPYVDTQSIRELESMEKRVSDHGGSLIRSFGFEESETKDLYDHRWTITFCIVTAWLAGKKQLLKMG